MSPEKLFFLLSDETRLRCLVLLYTQKELCVCEMHQVLEISQSKASRHLALLRSEGLIVDERKKQWIYYKINPELSVSLLKILYVILDALEKEAPFLEDIRKISFLKKEDLCKK